MQLKFYQAKHPQDKDIDEASEAGMDASDPPAFTATKAGQPARPKSRTQQPIKQSNPEIH
jgi:hypothetical protein